MSRYLALSLLFLAAGCTGGHASITAPRVATCELTQPTGRLVSISNGRAYRFTTVSNWTVTVDSFAMKVTPPGAVSQYDFWSSNFETLSGKLIKRLLQRRRSLELDGGTLLTIAGDSLLPNDTRSGMQAVRWISIYDGNESHRIIFTNGIPSVARSCALARFEEDKEYDGEGGRLTEAQGGLRFENTYTQGVSATGVPLAKVMSLVPLGQTYYATPNRVDDFFTGS